MGSKKLFDEMKNTRLRSDDTLKKELLKKINEVKMGDKTPEQKKVVDILEKFYHSKEEVCNFF